MRGARGWAILTAVGLLASTALLVAPTGVANAAPKVTNSQLSTKVATAKGAKLTVKAANPAADNKTVVSFDFARKDTYKNRWVSVQYLSPATKTWKSVKVLKMNSSGKGTVKLSSSYQTRTFRAVAFKGTYKKKAYALVTTPSAAASTYWKKVFGEEFSKSLATTKTFASRGVDVRGGFRVCSTPSESNLSVKSGKLNLKFAKVKKPTKATNDAIVAALKEAKAAAVEKAQKALDAANTNTKKLSAAKEKAAVAAAKKALDAAKKTPTSVAKGCPQGVFTNAMVGTQNTFMIPKGASGVVTARVKFPSAKGMHGAVWLQSSTNNEIDILESFGLGAGVASYVHIPKVDGSTVKTGGYVGGSAVKKAAWFKKEHTVSVEYDSSKVVYRLDGKVTKTIKKNMTKQDYFLVLSLLSSDWELSRLNKKTTSATMQVNWVRAYVKNKNV